MDRTTALALYRTFAGDRATFLYSGRFQDEHTARLIALGEEFLEHEDTDKAVRGKLAFIMVEAYQNIIRHRAALPIDQQEGNGRSFFMLRSDPSRHEVSSVNPVTRVDAANLSDGLLRLEASDQKEKKQMFLASLQRAERTERGGAGLGLIEIARRSGHGLRHGFRPLGADHQLFAFQALVGRKATWCGTLGQVFELHRVVAQYGLSVICRGHLSTGEQEVILRMIERDLDSESGGPDPRTRTYLAAMEMLHGLGAVGEGPMVTLGRSGNAMHIVITAQLGPVAKARIEEAVSTANALDAGGLQRRYRDILLGRGEHVDTVHLGLIELARKSIVPLRLDMSEAQGGHFMVLHATV